MVELPEVLTLIAMERRIVDELVIGYHAPMGWVIVPSDMHACMAV
jgi:hypothetical protein